jgi:hypothetical protein
LAISASVALCEPRGGFRAHQPLRRARRGHGARRIDLDRRLGQPITWPCPSSCSGIYHGDPTRAIAHYQEALTLAEEIGEPSCCSRYDGPPPSADPGDDGLAEVMKAQAVCERAARARALVVLPFLD